jgi:hypothetical protein
MKNKKSPSSVLLSTVPLENSGSKKKPKLRTIPRARKPRESDLRIYL